MTVVAFDIDGCLINDDDTPNYPAIDLLRNLHAIGCDVLVWSGGGLDYARRWVQRLGLLSYVTEVVPKGTFGLNWEPDICFDDENAEALAKVCVRVPFVNVDRG